VEPVLLLLPVLPVCAAAPATTAMLSTAESANLFMPSYLSDFGGSRPNKSDAGRRRRVRLRGCVKLRLRVPWSSCEEKKKARIAPRLDS
jgi:hypothetical protein